MTITDGNSWRSHTDPVYIADPVEADVHGDTIRQFMHLTDFVGKTPLPRPRPSRQSGILCDMYTSIQVLSIPRHTQTAMLYRHTKYTCMWCDTDDAHGNRYTTN